MNEERVLKNSEYGDLTSFGGSSERSIIYTQDKDENIGIHRRAGHLTDKNSSQRKRSDWSS